MNQPHTDTPDPLTKSRRLPWFWAIALAGALICGGIGAKAMHLTPNATLGVMVAMLPLVSLLRATERAQAMDGCTSPAMRHYNRRMVLWAFAYVLALFAAIWVDHQWHPGGAPLFVVAIVPALPVLGMLWAVQRYLTEEQDEFLRLRFTRAALTGTGILLATATVWGFLESFHVVPHAPGWLAVAVWGAGTGLSRCFDHWRNA